MFWKIIEILVRIIFFRRFYKAKKIGQAASLLSEGKKDEALLLLNKHGKSIHKSLLPLYIFTHAKVLCALGRFDEAKHEFIALSLLDKSPKADFELALIEGRVCNFTNCRQHLQKVIEKDDDEYKQKALEIIPLLEKTENGSREEEFKKRALKMAQILNLKLEKKAIETNFNCLKDWIRQNPEKTRDQFDEVALLAGELLIQKEGKWKVALFIEDCVVVDKSGSQINPFDLVDSYLNPQK